MKRIANYRSGDRAEALGVVLLQSFCAVASVPRQEDFGLVDAVATLLRRDGRLLYAEDSFAVQFKSRTEKVIKYLDKRFAALLAQDLSLFIAHVNLKAAEVKLFGLGVALSHPNINDVAGLVVHLAPVAQRIEKGVLHTSLGDPMLKWTTADLDSRDFEQTSYKVMKQWLDLDRWNRRYRKMGMRTSIQWKTNEAPSPGGMTTIWNPARRVESLTELVPAVQMIAGRATSDAAIAPTVLQLIAWMRAEGVDPDRGGVYGLMLKGHVGGKRLAEALSANSEADVGVLFFDILKTFDGYSFWVQSAGREGRGNSEKHVGTIADLRAKGFVIEVPPGSQGPDEGEISISIGSPWLDERKWEVIGVHDRVFLLRKTQAGLPQCPEK
jgi:hypothetical protein